MSTEIWKDIDGYEGLYKVSNIGRVRNERCMIMKGSDNGRGYLSVRFCINYLKRSKKIHRLVAEAFIPNPLNKPQVNHINGIKTDNRVENLEWCTLQENIDHAVSTGLWDKNKHNAGNGENNGFSKLTEKDVLEIRSKFKPRIYTRDMLAVEYGVKASCIKDVVNRKSWKHI